MISIFLARTISLLRDIALIVCFTLPLSANAANLLTAPATGVYPLNSTFTVKVVVNTKGQSINAAEGTLTFNPRELSVVRLDRSSSVFNLWVTEPSFSNSAGTISFSGGSPTGYTGTAGTVFTVTFRALTAGATRLVYTTGSVLANDGRGTNVLSAMSGGTYTIEAASTQPAPEVVIEYVAPANTPDAPKIESLSHSNPASWYQERVARLSWILPTDVTAVRTLLDKSQNSIPTKVYDTPISSIVLEDLEEGVSYFHIQFRNADGWGKVTHYRLAVDTVDPVGMNVELASSSDSTNPTQFVQVTFAAEEDGSPIEEYRISIQGESPVVVKDPERTGVLALPALPPGYHAVAVEAVDAAGNSSTDTLTISVDSFEAPSFVEYPSEVSPDVIPVFKGRTRPLSVVEVAVGPVGSQSEVYRVSADESGMFTFIPVTRFATGVYQLSAIATDVNGAQSTESSLITFAVQQPGYLRIGSWLVNTLSVIIPLIALVMLLVISLLWFRNRARIFRGRVSKESTEAMSILEGEFSDLAAAVVKERETLTQSKRTKKLSESEEKLFTNLLGTIEGMHVRVRKEMQDVERLVNKSDK